jgi:cell division protein FtsZ
MAFSYVESDNSAKIKVIGVGGAGGNAVNNMIDAKLQGVKFIVANTDIQALEASKAEVKIQIGRELTEGLGAGANPSKGEEAALESREELREALEGAHMVFITAGFGGGTGTGAAPVIAEICKDLGILTVAVASKPFSFEGKKRERQALAGLEKLHGITDTVITIPNDRLRGIAPKGARMIDMYIKADEILHHSVKGITDLIMMPGHVNLDFADVRATMQKAGKALMGIGIASGENRAVEAAERAISHPLLEDISISGAKGVLMNITSSSDLTLDEMAAASDRIYEEVGDDAEIIWGQTFDDDLGDEMRITVIATGIGVDDPAVTNNIRQFDPIPQAPVRSQQPTQPVSYPQTAMATGTMGAAAEPVMAGTMAQPVAGQQEMQTYAGASAGSIVRGQVRTPTQAELSNWNEFDTPVIVKTRKVSGDENIIHDYSNNNFDSDDLEVPTFLRRKAD